MTDKLNPFSQNDYEMIKRETLYQGFFRLARYHLRYRTFNGGWSQLADYEILERKTAAAILPYDPILDQVVLIEQFRPGAISNPQSPWLLEIVAGIFNPDEKPEQVVKRESREECGCDILDLYPICEYFVSPGGSNEYIHLFLGRIDASEVGGLYGLASENEDIRAFTLPADEAFAMIQEGKFKNAPPIITLQWLQLNREWLKQLWQTK